MRTSENVKNQVINLRLSGLTISEIRHNLSSTISKSTVSQICKNIVLPDAVRMILEQKSLTALESNRRKALESNKLKLQARLEAIKLRAIEAVVGNNMDKIALAMLYLGEGSKRTYYRGLSLGSSDPMIVKLYISLLESAYGIQITDMRFRILYRSDQDLDALEDYWSKQVGCDKSQFYKTTYDKRTENKPTLNKEYKGVCVVSCAGADIQAELAFITQYLYEKSLTDVVKKKKSLRASS